MLSPLPLDAVRVFGAGEVPPPERLILFVLFPKR
jgi:hypothetical protein